jgi:hypothetical protein
MFGACLLIVDCLLERPEGEVVLRKRADSGVLMVVVGGDFWNLTDEHDAVCICVRTRLYVVIRFGEEG